MGLDEGRGVLDQAVYTLAEQSYLPKRGDGINTLLADVQRAVAEFAALGIVGGPTVAKASEIANVQLRVNGRFAADDLLRACRTHNLRYYPELVTDLTEAYQRLTAAEVPGIVNNVAAKLAYIPDPGAVRGNLELVLQQGYAGQLASAIAEFAHYATELQVAETEAAAAVPAPARPTPWRRFVRSAKDVGIIAGAVAAVGTLGTLAYHWWPTIGAALQSVHFSLPRLPP